MEAMGGKVKQNPKLRNAREEEEEEKEAVVFQRKPAQSKR